MPENLRAAIKRTLGSGMSLYAETVYERVPTLWSLRRVKKKSKYFQHFAREVP